jgi:hypothetical protein
VPAIRIISGSVIVLCFMQDAIAILLPHQLENGVFVTNGTDFNHSKLARQFAWFLVVPQSHESRMAQVTIGSPLDELKLAD